MDYCGICLNPLMKGERTLQLGKYCIHYLGTLRDYEIKRGNSRCQRCSNIQDTDPIGSDACSVCGSRDWIDIESWKRATVRE